MRNSNNFLSAQLSKLRFECPGIFLKRMYVSRKKTETERKTFKLLSRRLRPSLSKLLSTCFEKFLKMFVTKRIEGFSIIYGHWAKNVRLPAKVIQQSCQNCIIRVRANFSGRSFFEEKICCLLICGYWTKSIQVFCQNVSAVLSELNSKCPEEHPRMVYGKNSFSFFFFEYWV